MFLTPSSQSSIAGSFVTLVSRSPNEPSAPVRSVWFWFSMSDCEPTFWFDVANQSCQMSVIRSISG